MTLVEQAGQVRHPTAHTALFSTSTDGDDLKRCALMCAM